MSETAKSEQRQEMVLTKEERVWVEAWRSAIKANRASMDSRTATDWADDCLKDFKARFGSNKM